MPPENIPSSVSGNTDDEKMNYQEQLESDEWRSKRNEILERDNFHCTKCNAARSKFLGLSQNFGIKTFNELQEKGFSYKRTDDKSGILFLKNGLQQTFKFIEEADKNTNIVELFFAQKWKEPKNKFVFGTYELICFTKNISINDRFPDLNVHHKFYIENRRAWEYENEVLVTLCEKCHQEEHKENEIKVFDENGNFLYKPLICDRCFGSGYLPEFHYFQSGICFKCWGNGILLK